MGNGLVSDDVWQQLDPRGGRPSVRERRMVWVLVPIAALALLFAVLSANAQPVGRPGVPPEQQRLVTCCLANDIDTIQHPGDVIRLHWQTSDGTGNPVNEPVKVDSRTQLTAKLSGPYADAMDVKRAVSASEAPAHTYAADILTVEAGVVPAESPVSEIRLPADAAPGFYELDWDISINGGTFGGGSIVEVTARK